MMAMVFAGSTLAAGTKDQSRPVTPAVKAFINQAAMKYAKTPCVDRYSYLVDASGTTARFFDIMYKQAIGQAEAQKVNGLYYESGKQKNSFWVFTTNAAGKSAMLDVELRNGELHAYTCSIHL